MSCGLAKLKMGYIWTFQVDLEGQGWWLHKTTGIFNKVFYTSDLNLVILAYLSL